MPQQQIRTLPKANWAHPQAVARALAFDGRAGDQILLGQYGDDLLGIRDDRHVTTIAGNRAGKTLTLIATLLFWLGSVFAIDPKGELARLTAARRRALGQKVFVLDPFNITEEGGAGFNPMTQLTPQSPTLVEDAGQIADGLVNSSKDDKGRHWDDSAKNFIEGLVLLVALDPAFEGRRNLATVRALLMRGMDFEGERGLDGLELIMRACSADIVQSAAADLFDKPDDERGSVLSTARRHTKFLDLEAIQSVLTRHDFDLSDLKTGHVSVYLCLPAGRLATCSAWFRMFINQLLDAMERTPGQPKTPVLLALDEFANAVGYLKSIEVAAGLIAGYGVKIWTILQDLGQLQSLYKERWETFIGNAGIVQCFANNDLTTLDWISRRCGDTSYEVASRREPTYEEWIKGGDGISYSHQTGPLITPAEVAEVFGRDQKGALQIVLVPGKKPVICSRVEWYKRPDLKALIDGGRPAARIGGKPKRPVSRIRKLPWQ